MAFSKAKLFDPDAYSQSFWSKALSHPARIIILNQLLEYGLTSFQEINKQIPLASTTVSQHLRFLVSYGLIKAEEKFPYTYYDINKDTCKNLALQITDFHLDFIRK